MFFRLNKTSWEPSGNVEGCDRLLASFWKHVGTDDDDYEEGYMIEAKHEWIGDLTFFSSPTFVYP
jgi:hypothetical protein